MKLADPHLRHQPLQLRVARKQNHRRVGQIDHSFHCLLQGLDCGEPRGLKRVIFYISAKSICFTIKNDVQSQVEMCTGKSMSEALILAPTNPKYDNRLFIELQVQHMKISSSEHGENMLCTEIVFDIQNNFCTQHVLPMFCKNKSF